MKKILFLLLPLSILISCKKRTEFPAPVPIPPTEEPKDIIDITNPFKDIIKSDVTKSFPYLLREQTGITYMGYLTTEDDVKNKNLNPLTGAKFVHTDFSFKDIKNNITGKYSQKEPVRSSFNEVFDQVQQQEKKVLTPKIDYQIYTSNNIDNETRTDVYLAVKATYFYLEADPIKEENIKLFNNMTIDKLKESGIYLSKLGYGLSFILKISSKENPKRIVPYLRAYVEDLLNNGGAKSAELKKFLPTSPNLIYEYYSGKTYKEWMPYQQQPILDRIKNIINKLFIPQPQDLFNVTEFEFKSLKTGKAINLGDL